MKIIRFSATWCPDCLIMGSRWQKVLAEFPALAMETFDADKDVEQKKQYAIKKASTFIFFSDDGREILRREGLLEVEELADLIKNHLDK